MNTSGSGKGTVACSDEQGNITSASIKYEKFIYHKRNCYVFKRDDLAFKFYKQKGGSKGGENEHNCTSTPSVCQHGMIYDMI